MIHCLDETEPPLTLPEGCIGPVHGVPAAVAEAWRRLADWVETPLIGFHPATAAVVWQSDAEILPCGPLARRMNRGDIVETEILSTADGLAYFLHPCSDPAKTHRYVIAGYCLTRPGAMPQDLVLESLAAGWSSKELHAHLAQLPVFPERTLRKLLRLAGDQWQARLQREAWQAERDQLTRQLESREEELRLKRELLRRLQLPRHADELAVLCVERLHKVVPAAGHAICLESSADHVQFLVEGRLPFDEAELALLLSRFDDHDWSRPLVKNHLPQSALGADFPGLDNLMVAAINEGSTRRGWIVSVNATDGREFQAGDTQTLTAIADLIGTHLRNLQQLSQHEDLLLSFVRLLVSTLDAKDAYTRGHSERVALIARKLGEQLGLPKPELEDIYLAGLLHDLGKIGVDDRILRKPEQLTDKELEHIQQHPVIGAQILSQLKNLQRILPGVRSHHEAFDGSGYPDRLRGEEIPLMARIIAVADAYDAMCSDRPYRKGMAVEKLDEIFRRGSGRQWDARVIDAYFAVRGEIIRLCAEYSPTAGNLLAERTPERASGITVRTFPRQ